MKKLLGVLAGLTLIAGGLWLPATAGTNAASFDHQVEADLNGFAEVNSTTGAFGAGDLDGDGVSSFTLDAGDGVVCFVLRWSDIDRPTAAHIHRGAVGVNGPIVVDLLSNADRIRHNDATGTGGAEGCTEGVSSALVTEIGTTPGAFYANVHNAAFPGGAIRGNLEGDEAGI